MSKYLGKVLEELEAGVKDIFENDKFKDYLNILGRLHTYSPANCILIAVQNPKATMVAGFNAWKKMNRYVKKGEKGIRIMCPFDIKKEIEENGEKKELVFQSFKPGYVFDITQTGGHDVPSYIVELLKGKVEDYEQIKNAIASFVPAEISIEDFDEEYNGCYIPSSNRILVKKSMDEIQQIKTLLHESAHCLLHKSDEENKIERAQREIEAEGTAYAVCRWLGLDTSDYSFKYVAEWSTQQKDSDLKDSLVSISKTAKELIEGIEANLKGEKK